MIKTKKFMDFLKRNYQWKNYLNSWEIDLINYICGKRMKSLGYKDIAIIKSY